MSGGTKNQTYFYIGADHGLAIFVLMLIIIAITTIIGTAILLVTH